jgi:hypothetical protein
VSGSPDGSEFPSLPPNEREWIDKNVIALRDVLANPEVRARIRELLDAPTIRQGTDDAHSETN